MRILVLGSGGREHALCWKLAQEAEVYCAPGNPGIEVSLQERRLQSAFGCQTSVWPPDANPLELAKALKPDLVLIGPEAPLIAGLADELRSHGLAVFGPGKAGAALEGSKAFSKAIMLAAKVPTARSVTTSSESEARAFALKLFDAGSGAVIKASGPALGKGVVVCYSKEQAAEVIKWMMVDREFGDAGAEVVVEERIDGREFSLLTLCNEKGMLSLPVAQDYKRALNNDRGPNTGGMGSYSPVPWVSDSLVSRTEEYVVRPLLAELKKRRIEFRGMLFSGLMVKGDKPICLEYNVRFGDPETQSIVRRLGNGFADALLQTALGRPIPKIEIINNVSVTVVVASAGYPRKPIIGKIIHRTELPDEVIAFHAGTVWRGNSLVTAGGRVLGVSATGESISEARAKAYEGVKCFGFAGMRYRRDIALTTDD